MKREPVSMILFLHIEKTGGTSLARALKDVCRIAAVNFEEWPDAHQYATHRQYSSSLRDAQKQAQFLNNVQNWDAVHGHFSYGVHEVFPAGVDCEYITLLRDPIDRFVSHYIHLIETNYRPDLQDALKSNPVGVVGMTGIPEVCNLCVRRLTGKLTEALDEPDLERATRRLETFAEVGLLEQFTDFRWRLAVRYGWAPLREYRFNVNEQSATLRAQFIQSELEAIREANALDMALYERVFTWLNPS